MNFQKHIKLLLLVSSLLLSNTGFTQGGSSFQLGLTYPLLTKNQNANEPECPDPSTGLCVTLTTKYTRLPFLNLGYTYRRTFKSYPGYGWIAGTEYKSFHQKEQVLKDENYYRYFNNFGYYPLVEFTKFYRHYLFLMGGLFYEDNHVNISAGLSTEVFRISKGKEYTFDGAAVGYSRQSATFAPNFFVIGRYKFHSGFGLYLSFNTQAYKTPLTRNYLFSAGIDFELM